MLSRNKYLFVDKIYFYLKIISFSMITRKKELFFSHSNWICMKNMIGFAKKMYGVA